MATASLLALTKPSPKVADTTLSRILHTGIETLYKDNSLTDVNIQIGFRRFPCHKLVLSAMSPYFTAMFTSGFQDKHQDVVKLQSVDHQAFHCILQYIYCSQENIITVNNVAEILGASCMLLMQHIKVACENFIIARLCSENVINTWKLATSLSCENLASTCKSFILKNFEKVIENDEFLDLEAEELSEIIRNESLNVSCEEIVGDAVLKWFEFDDVSRKTCLFDVLQHVKFPLTEPSYVFEISDKFEIFLEDPELRSLADEAKRFHCVAAETSESSTNRLVHRSNSNVADVLFFISSLGGQNKIFAYSFQNKKWTNLPQMPLNPGYGFASCLTKGNVYVSGGEQNQNCQLMKYSVENNTWKTVKSLLECRRYRHAMVKVAGSLVLLGGSDLPVRGFGGFTCVSGSEPSINDFKSNITGVDIKTSTISNLGQLCTAVRCMDAVVLGKKVFILGGKSFEKEYSSQVQCFDMSSKQCYIMDVTLPVSVNFSGAIRVDKKIIFSFGDKLCEWEPLEKKEIKVKQLPWNEQPRNRTNLCFFQEKLYLHVSAEEKYPVHSLCLLNDGITVLEDLPNSVPESPTRNVRSSPFSDSEDIFSRMHLCSIPKRHLKS